MPAVSYSRALRGNAEEDPDRPALTDSTGTWKRSEVDRMADRFGRALLAEGVEPGGVVAISGPNSARLLGLVFGIWRIGAIPLHLHARKTRDDIEALLGLARPVLAVGYEEEIRCEARSLSLDALFTRGSPEPLPTDLVSSNIRIGASGGSTGRSKLIVVDAPALINRERPWHFGLERDGVQVVPLELVDGTGFVAATASLAMGCHLVLMREFEPEETLALIEAYRADWLALTPPLMLQIWKLGDDVRNRYDLASLRAVTHYSGPVAPWLKRAWMGWLGAEKIVESYGATDSRGSTWIDGVEWLERPGSVGRARRGCEIAIFDQHKKPVPTGIPGDIYIRDLTGRVNFHYLGGEVETLPGGWETVGDFGWLDSDGYLYIGDRRQDLICGPSGTIYPFEIEGAIEKHDAVRSAVVIGLPRRSDDHGKPPVDRIHAIVDAPYRDIDGAELVTFLRETIGAELVPESFEFCNEPLRDHAGKAQRAKLKAARAAGHR